MNKFLKLMLGVVAILTIATTVGCKKTNDEMSGPQVSIKFNVDEHLQTVREGNSKANQSASSTDMPNWLHIKGGDYNVLVKCNPQSAGAAYKEFTCKYNQLSSTTVTLNAGVYSFEFAPVSSIQVSKDALYKGTSIEYDIDADFSADVVFDAVPEPMVLVHKAGITDVLGLIGYPQATTFYPFLAPTTTVANQFAPGAQLNGLWKSTQGGKEYYYAYVNSSTPYTMYYLESSLSNSNYGVLATWLPISLAPDAFDWLPLLKDGASNAKPMKVKTIYYLVKQNEGNFNFASVEQPFNDIIRIDY